MYIRYAIPLLILLALPASAATITEQPDSIENGHPIYITITGLADGSRFDLLIDSSFTVQQNSDFSVQMSQFSMPFALNDGTVTATLDGTSENRLEVMKGDTIVAVSGRSVDGHYTTTKEYDITRGTYDYFRLSGVSLPTAREVQAKLQVSGVKEGADDSEITFVVEGMPEGTITIIALVDGAQALYRTVTVGGQTTSSSSPGSTGPTATVTPTPTAAQTWKDFASADGKTRVRAFGADFVGLVAVSPQDVPAGMRVVAGPYSVMPADLAFDPAATLAFTTPTGIPVVDLQLSSYSGGSWSPVPAEMVSGELQASIPAAGVYALLAPVPPETTVTETASPATTAPATTAPTKAGMEILTVVAGAAVSLGLAAGRKG